MVEVSITYEGNFRCLSTHGPSGAVLPTDAPKDNLGKGEAFSPTDLTATSLGACMLTTMAIVAQKKSLQVDLAGSKVHVVKHMTANGPRRIAKLEVNIEVFASASPEERAVLTHAAFNCPVALSLHPDVKVTAEFHWKK